MEREKKIDTSGEPENSPGEIFVAGFVRNSFVDLPGKICSVVFLGGCNFDCHYCHNHKILGLDSNTIDFDEILTQIREQIGFIDGVVISGGEPTVHPHLREVIGKIRGLGLPVKLDTNGSNFEILRDLVDGGAVEFVAMDIKAPLPRYAEIAGVDVDVSEIKKSIDFLKSRAGRGGFDFLFRTTPTPELGKRDYDEILELVGGARWQKNHYVSVKR